MPPTGDLEIQRALDLGWVYEASCRRREAAPTRPGQLVDVGTHHVGVYEAGEASPTVVFVRGVSVLFRPRTAEVVVERGETREALTG